MHNTIEKIWQDVQAILSKEIKGPSFQSWIKPSKLIELNENNVVLAVKNEFNKNFLKQYYFEKIINAVEQVLKKKVTLEIVVKGDLTLSEFIPSIANLRESSSPHPPIPSSPFPLFPTSPTNLNPSYTFESFVVGPNNQFCHGACLAIAEVQSEHYNPLFIYGSVGLGKTHLTHAVGNYMISQNKEAKVKYISSESFTNELIQSIRSDSTAKFRKNFRDLDLLVIDDVQFLAGKERTQEEFFHTFNTLKESGKQIILTSDRPPSQLTSIADRLKNRFEGGLIADIQIPDLETRIAILMLKAAQLNIKLEIKVAEYIARIFPNNIRELEGALKRVYAYLSFTQEELTLKNVQKVLNQGNNIESSKPKPESILKVVAAFYNITYEDLISPKRSSDLMLPRHIAIFLLHEFYNLSFPRIGEMLSNRTHSAAIYAYNQVKKKLIEDKELTEEISSLKGLLERRR